MKTRKAKTRRLNWWNGRGVTFHAAVLLDLDNAMAEEVAAVVAQGVVDGQTRLATIATVQTTKRRRMTSTIKLAKRIAADRSILDKPLPGVSDLRQKPKDDAPHLGRLSEAFKTKGAQS